MDAEGFERLVQEALRHLPDWVARQMHDLEVVIEERPSRSLCKSMGIDYREGLLGLYEGPSRLERDVAAMDGPSRVSLFRRMILAEADGEADLPRVVRETLAHEIGHHFGMTEEEMDAFERAWAARG